MFDFFKRKRAQTIPFEDQLKVLVDCGISLSPLVKPETLLQSFSREDYAKSPFRLLMCAMGDEAEDQAQSGDTGYPSNNIWHFDTECIEDHGDYASIARRLSVMAHPVLPIKDVQDCVDVENGEAWLSFTLDGKAHKWMAKVNDDWVDDTILSRFATLLEGRETDKRFTYIDLGGQDCLIGCATPNQRETLVSATKLNVEWLR